MDIPPRTATDSYLSQRGQHLDVVFDLDLGELIKGHHVVARGIQYGRPVSVPDVQALVEVARSSNNGGGFFKSQTIATRQNQAQAALHYEFVPGLSAEDADGFGWYWLVSVSDDVGTEYGDYNGGAFDSQGGGSASHGTRDLGGQIPAEASRLTLRFTPVEGWMPPDSWRHEVEIDLRNGRLVGLPRQAIRGTGPRYVAG